MNDRQVTFLGITVKTIVVHTVTYFVMGVLAFIIMDYETTFAETDLRYIMRQTDDAMVMAGPLFQPIRGLLFGIVFFLLSDVFFGRKNGWIIMWLMLVIVGILSTFGPTSGSIEGMIYTTFPIWDQLVGLWETVLQSLLLSYVICFWVNHPEKKWLNITLGMAFSMVILLTTMGLLAS
ncbi:MAG: hypothetical protein V3U24_03500 [Candidatus Neomarinimicrobiota bacterium]